MRYDYREEHFQKVKVKGIPCEFCDGRIDRSTVPAEKFLYEVAGDDDGGWDPARVKKAIMANFYGTLICEKELPLGDDGVLWLEDDDFVYTEGINDV